MRGLIEHKANGLEHIGADGGVMYIGRHFAPRTQSRDGKGEGPSRGVDEHILRTQRGLLCACDC